MDSNSVPSAWFRIWVPSFFLVMALLAFCFFVSELITLINYLTSLNEVIVFAKGPYYALGAGVGLGIFALFSVCEMWFGKIIQGKVANCLFKVVMIAVLCMFIFPHIVHFSLEQYLTDKGYEVCEEASHQWLHSRTIVYSIDRDTCLQYAEKHPKPVQSLS